MTPREIEDALRGMVILVDTREQDTPRFRARLESMNCLYERCKLDFGDYSAKFSVGGEWLMLNAAVERKMDFSELAQCFCNGRARFAREFERAKAADAKIYLLIENQCWEDAYSGNYRSQMNPQAFVASLLAWLARYRCQIIFCDQRTSGNLIHDILYREGREMLERMMLSESKT
jgi:ERCC4-type nuclease